MTEGRSITLDVQYSTVYETEIPSTDGQPGAGGASGGGNWKAGDSVVLQNVPFYYASTSAGPSAYKSGTFYFYDGLCVNGRYRMTISADRCGKKPIPVNVTGWVRAEDCGATGENTGAGGTKKRSVTKAVRQVEGDVLSLSYTDSAADESDSVDITLNAEDDQWLGGWMPEKGATLRPRIEGQNWEREGDRRRIRCGLFTLDDINYKDTSSTLRMGECPSQATPTLARRTGKPPGKTPASGGSGKSSPPGMGWLSPLMQRTTRSNATSRTGRTAVTTTPSVKTTG